MSALELSGKERRSLRALGQTSQVSANVGKGGLSPAVLKNLEIQIGRLELIKVQLPGDSKERKAMAVTLAEKLKAASLGGVGRNFLFWRPKPEDEVVRDQ